MQTNAFSKQEIGVTLAVVLLVGVLELVLNISWLHRGVAAVSLPIATFSIQGARTIRQMTLPLSQHYDAQERINQLSELLAQTEGVAVQLEQLTAENAELRLLLENRHLRVKPRRLARPIVSSATPLVWLGEASDVQPGWLVLYKDTVLGKVTAVDGQYARVGLLVASEDFSLLVQTQEGVKGIARAQNGVVVVTNITPEAVLMPGERVTTVGQPGVAPGKFVGLITAIERDVSKSYQTASIDQLVSFYQTSIVEIEE